MVPADAGIHSRVNSATSELGGRSDTPLVPLASPLPLARNTSEQTYKSMVDLQHTIMKDMSLMQPISPEQQIGKLDGVGKSPSIHAGNMVVIFLPRNTTYRRIQMTFLMIMMHVRLSLS